MAYLENIKKINELAKTLTDNGIAPNTTMAINMAQGMVTKDTEVKDTEKFIKKADERLKQLQPDVNENTQDNVKTEGVNSFKFDSQKIDEKIDEKIKQHRIINEIRSQILEMRHMMGVVRKEMDDLKMSKAKVQQIEKEIREVKQESVIQKSEPEPIASVEQTNQTEPQQAAQEPAPKAEPKKDSHPRKGDFTPDDVAIEKIFYYGNK